MIENAILPFTSTSNVSPSATGGVWRKSRTPTDGLRVRPNDGMETSVPATLLLMARLTGAAETPFWKVHAPLKTLMSTSVHQSTDWADTNGTAAMSSTTTTTANTSDLRILASFGLRTHSD